MEQKTSFGRRVFLFAAIYGVLALLPQYFMENKIGHDYPPAITHPEHFYGFIGVALTWQILFLLIAKDPIRYRPIMLVAILEKLAWGVPCIALYLQGRLVGVALAFGFIDLFLAILFYAAFRSMRDSG